VPRVSPSVIEVTVLAFWLGAAAFFTVAVAPVLFAVLPTRTLAGEVVGRVLPGVLYSGIVVGVLIVAIEIASHGVWRWRGREMFGALIAVACAIAQLVVGPRIAQLRAQIAGPVESLAVDDARRLMFGRLHGVSVAWLGVAMLAAAIALVLSARTLKSQS
jgi:uncharacterized protein DUF4149